MKKIIKMKVKAKHNDSTGNTKFKIPKEMFYSLDITLASFIRDSLKKFISCEPGLPGCFMQKQMKKYEGSVSNKECIDDLIHDDYIKELKELEMFFDKYATKIFEQEEITQKEVNKAFKKLGELFGGLWL